MPASTRRLDSPSSERISARAAFGLWSNEPPDAAFTDRLAAVFASAEAAPVTFWNPLQDREVTQTVYLATAGAG